MNHEKAKKTYRFCVWLRLDVLQVLAEKYGVRAFALEGDFGGCEAINHYIHGEGGTAAS